MQVGSKLVHRAPTRFTVLLNKAPQPTPKIGADEL